MSLDFGPLVITDALGVTHQGVRPSLLPRPFRRAGLALPGGNRECRWPPGLVPAGFDATVNVSLDPCGASETLIRYRLVALMADGRKWSVLYDPDGNMVAEGWL